MAYIDPEGMFGGDRMALLSDSARFAWPWFWCAGNTVGRMELNYRGFLNGAFRQFKKPPTEKQFWGWVTEFHESFLLFVYEINGQVWGQWSISEKYLPDYKRKADTETPAPNAKEFLDWQKEYLESKRSRAFSKCRVLSSSKISQKVGGDFPKEEEKELELEEEFKTSCAAGAAGVLDFPPPQTEDQLIMATAERILARHPKKRISPVKKVAERLKAIVGKLPKSERSKKLGEIDTNHHDWCQSEKWQKDAGEYANGLANWLKPSDGLFELRPPARASPPSKWKEYKLPTLEDDPDAKSPTNP